MMHGPSTIISPWLSRHRGRALPAIHHREYSGSQILIWDRAKPLPAAGNLIYRFVKDAGSKRVAGRQLFDADQGGASAHIPARFWKDPASGNRVRLRSHYCDSSVHPDDVARPTGSLWKEGRLFASAVASSASATVFTMVDNADTLGWWTNDPAAASTPPILDDTFAGYVLEWTAGANAGTSVEVAGSSASTFTLASAMPNAIQAGDSFALRRTMHNRTHGRVYRRPRVQAYWANGTTLPGTRHNKLICRQLGLTLENFAIGPRDEIVDLYQPFPWSSFATWNEVRNEIDFWDPAQNRLRPIEVQYHHIAPLLDHEFILRAHPPTISGVNGQGYVLHAGSWGREFDQNNNPVPNANNAIIVARNTAFSDSPQIPLPITFYIVGVYLAVEHFSTSTWPGHEDETGVLPWVKACIIIEARDGAGNILFDNAVEPYATIFNAWFGDNHQMPPRFKAVLEFGYWDPYSYTGGAPVLGGRNSPCMLGQSVNPNAQPSNWLSQGLVEVPPYTSECQSVWGGTYKSEGRGSSFLTQEASYHLFARMRI